MSLCFIHSRRGATSCGVLLGCALGTQVGKPDPLFIPHLWCRYNEEAAGPYLFRSPAASNRCAVRGAGELAGAQRARGEPSLSVWSAKHAIARSAKGLRQQTRSHVQARPPLSQYNLPDDGYAANHLRPPQEPVETDGLCDDPGAVSKVAIRDTEPKLHRNHRLVPSRESASGRVPQAALH